MRVIIPIVVSCTALMLMSCYPSIQDMDIKAEGTIKFQLADGELFTVDLAKCWQSSFLEYVNGEQAYVLDIVCDDFSIYSRFSDILPEGREKDDFPLRVLWTSERFQQLTEACAREHNYRFSRIYPRKVLLSKHNGEAPYTYHLTTNPLTNAPDEEACAVYDVKVRVLSEPSGDSYDPPDLPPEAYGQ